MIMLLPHKFILTQQDFHKNQSGKPWPLKTQITVSQELLKRVNLQNLLYFYNNSINIACWPFPRLYYP